MFIYLVSPLSTNQSFVVALNHWLLRTFVFRPNAAPHLLTHLLMSLPLLLFLFSKPHCVWLPTTLKVLCWTWVIIVKFPARNNAFLDKIFVNSLRKFNVYLRSPLRSSDHCILKLMPKIYGHLGHIALTKDRHVRFRRRNCDTSAIISLQHMLNSTDFDIFYNPDLSFYVKTLSSYINFILDICCPFETLYIRTDCFSSPKTERKSIQLRWQNAGEEIIHIDKERNQMLQWKVCTYLIGNL